MYSSCVCASGKHGIGRVTGVACGSGSRQSDFFAMNGNYLPEIRQMTRNPFNYLTVDHENL